MHIVNQNYIQKMPDEILVNIFQYLDTQTITKLKCVCHKWKILIESNHSLRKKLPTILGAKTWEKHIGYVGPEPSIPSNIAKVLFGPSPICSDQCLNDSFFCILIPENLNKTSLTCSNFLNTVKEKHPELTPEKSLVENTTTSFPKSYWALVCKDLYLPSKKLSSMGQMGLLKGLNHYDFPYLREITFAYVLNYLEETSLLFTQSGHTDCVMTRCKETLPSPKTGFHRVFGLTKDKKPYIGFAPGNRIPHIGVCLVRRQNNELI